MTRFLTTASAAALSAVMAACASPNFPIEPGPAPPSRGRMAPIPNPPEPAEAPPAAAPSTSIQTGPIQTTPLPPPGPVTSQPLPSRPPSTYTPAPRAPSGPCPPGQMQRTITIPAPAPPPAAKPAGSGKVTNDTPDPVKVTSGDTLIAISRKTGVSVADLADLNKLKEPYPLKLGQLIKLPGKRFYTVVAGDNLYAIARRFGLTAAALTEFNEMEPSGKIRAGQRLNLPEDAKDKGAPVASRPPTPKPTTRTECVADPNWRPPPLSPAPAYTPPPASTYTPPPAPRPAPPPIQPQPVAPPAAPPAAAPSTSDVNISAAGRGRFAWPIRGDVIARFGPSGGGQRNDGINILAAPGAPVRAAAGGEVVYAGNQVPGFGNLVLIKHENGWVTAYAHLSNIDVKMRQQIASGQVLGQVGQTGTVDRPQLHFEVRYASSATERARPVDPMLVLPR